MTRTEHEATRVVVTGRVQGVAFRAYTTEQARALGVTGWVRNLRDGSVEVMICGSRERREALIAWLHRGAPMSRVDGLHCEPAAAGPFDDFRIA